MKSRIIKKLSKKIAEILPEMYKDAWIEKDIHEESYSQGNSVSGVLCIGGGLDYWGEGEDVYTVLEDFANHHDWHKPIYDPYPEGHKWEGMPRPRKMRQPTGQHLIKCAKLIRDYKASCEQ